MNDTVTDLPKKRRPRRTLWILAGLAAVAALGITAWRYAQAHAVTSPARPAAAATGVTPLRHTYRAPEMVLVMPAPPSHNAFPYFERAAQLAHSMKHYSPDISIIGSRLTPSFAAYRACAKDTERVLAVLRPALNRPFGRIWGAGGSFGIDLDNLAPFNLMEQQIDGASQYYYLNGEYNRAAQVVLDGAEAGAMIGHLGILADALISEECENISLTRFERTLSHLSAPQLAGIVARLDRIIAKQVPYADTLKVEKINTLLMEQQQLKDWKWNDGSFSTVRINLNNRASGPPSPQELSAYAVMANSDRNAVLWDNARYFDALIEEAKHPWTGDSAVPIPHNLFTNKPNYFTNARRSWVRKDSVMAILRTETALYRYRAEHGKFPVTLDALVPAYLPVVPDAPCSGDTRKLTYRLQAEKPGFLLYSIGLNRKDDGGLPTPTRSPWNNPAGDIVSGRNLIDNTLHYMLCLPLNRIGGCARN